MSGFRTASGFRTVLADPAWPEDGAGKIQRGANRHYDTMSVEEIASLPVAAICDDNCHLWLWVTNNYLPDGLAVMKAWGFRYVTNVAWAKRKAGKVQIGIGQYVRGSHELLLFGVRGKLPPYHFGKGFPAKDYCSLIDAPRRKHSQKPVQGYHRAETVSHAPRVELFARQRREGWAALGNHKDAAAEPGYYPGDIRKTLETLGGDKDLLRQTMLHGTDEDE